MPSRTTILYILIVVLAASTIISLAYAYVSYSSRNNSDSGRITDTLPVDIKSSGVKNPSLTYYLSGTLQNVTNSVDGPLWTVITVDNKQYQIYIIKNADIFAENPLQNPDASPSAIDPLNLVKGTKVEAYVGVNLENNKAYSGRIIIKK